jgi:hypothetical protein
MKMRTIRITLFIIIVAGIGIRLFAGAYIHDEFGETHFFIKHRPTWKWSFRSPVGQSDLKFEDLTPDDQKEQLLFDEFVRKRSLSK